MREEEDMEVEKKRINNRNYEKRENSTNILEKRWPTTKLDVKTKKYWRSKRERRKVEKEKQKVEKEEKQ